MIARLSCLLGQHQVYRERRLLAGVMVMHHVCDLCGHAEPVISRTETEYQEAAKSQWRAPRATKVGQPTAAERARILGKLGAY